MRQDLLSVGAIQIAPKANQTSTIVEQQLRL
jgi:hypothetical protein